MTDSTILISIVIPTFNRKEPLRRALASALAQRLGAGEVAEIVVVDNSVDATARWIEDAFAGTETMRLRYISEPRPGVANARNAGIAAAQGEWVAFLDDDEEAGPDWLAQHLAVLGRTKADASFGPVTAKPEEGEPPARLLQFFSRAIARNAGDEITDLAALLGTNNSVFNRERCLAGHAVFDTSLNETGGEDSLLLQQLVSAGRKLVWAADAEVLEWVPPRRLTWAYVARRRFLSGQIRTFVQHRLSPPRWEKILLWMGVGAIQAPLWFLISLALRPFDREKSSEAHSRAWGGLGKVFWARRFRPRLYGTGLVS